MSLPGVSFLGLLGISILILVADHETSHKRWTVELIGKNNIIETV